MPEYFRLVVAGWLGVLPGVLYLAGVGVAIGWVANRVIGNRRPLNLPKPVLVGTVVVFGLGGFFYSSLLFSGPGDNNCVGKSDPVRPVQMSDGSLQFAGWGNGSSANGEATAAFKMTALWQLSWDSQLVEFHIELYDATVPPPNHSFWNPFHDNQTGFIRVVFNASDTASHVGTSSESISGNFCLSVSWGSHGPNVARSTRLWVISVGPVDG